MEPRECPAPEPAGEAAASGVEAAASLLLRHRTEVFAYILAAVRNYHDAEDVLQEVSVAVVRSWQQYQPGTNFRAWVREIARRRLLNYGKTIGRLAVTIDDELLERLAEAAVQVEEEQSLAQRRVALGECLARLENMAQRVLRLRYGDGLNVDEIAGSVRRTVQATYAILKRTKQALRVCVERRLSASPGMG